MFSKIRRYSGLKEGKRKQDKLYLYGNTVMWAQLECKAKALLWFYAYAFRWDYGIPSFYSQERICAVTGMSPKTYQKARKYLESLGWIIVQKRSRRRPPLIWVKVGKDDPNYKSWSFSKGHPEYLKRELKDWDPAKYEHFDPNSTDSSTQITH